jgi:hypothetical protein
MPSGDEPRTLNASFFMLTAEIERLQPRDPDDQLRKALGPKIDEAAGVLGRIRLLNTSGTTRRPAT